MDALQELRCAGCTDCTGTADCVACARERSHHARRKQHLFNAVNFFDTSLPEDSYEDYFLEPAL